MPETDYTLAELENLYREANPGAPRSEVRREAKAEFRRRSEAAPHLILDIHTLKDPTCGEAEFNLRTAANRRAAERRIGVAQ